MEIWVTNELAILISPLLAGTRVSCVITSLYCTFHSYTSIFLISFLHSRVHPSQAVVSFEAGIPFS